MSAPNSVSVSLRGDGPWRGMVLNAPGSPVGHGLLENCYVSRDGSEIRMMPGFKCLIDPVTPARSATSGTGSAEGYECNVVESQRPVTQTISSYRFAKEQSFAQDQVIWTSENYPLFIEQVANRWVIVGETGTRREPILNTGRTAYVRVTEVHHVSSTQCDLTVNAQPDTTANRTNGVVVGNRITVSGLAAGVAGTALNGLSHEVASFPTGTTIRINTTIVDAANDLTGQTAFIDRISQDFDGLSNTISDDEVSLTAWHVRGKGDPTGDPVTVVAPSHVANRRRDYGDTDSAGGGTVTEGNSGRSRRRQFSMPFRPNPHVADQQIIMAVPGYGCAMKVPVLTPPQTGDSTDLDGFYPSNSIWDMPRSVGIPKALVWEDTNTNAEVIETNAASIPAASATTITVGGASYTTDQFKDYTIFFTSGAASGQSAVISSNTATTITFASTPAVVGTTPSFVIFGDTWHVTSTAVTQEAFGGSNTTSGVPRVGSYGFMFAYRDDATGEMGLPSDPIFVTTNAVTNTLQAIRFRILFPGYVLPECLALTIVVFRTAKNGTSGSTFYYDRSIRLTNSHFGTDPTTGLVDTGSVNMVWKSDADLQLSTLVPVPTLNQMPMGCSDAITARSWTCYAGALGNAGPDLSLIQTDLAIRYDAKVTFDSIYPQKDTVFTHGSSSSGSRSYFTGDSGTATAVTTTSLTDGAKTWITDQWIHWTVRITSGAASGEERTITSNTGTVLSFDTISTLTGTPTYIILARQPRFTGMSGIPSSYAERPVFSHGLFPYPEQQVTLHSMRNPRAAFLAATSAVPESQIREFRWRVRGDLFQEGVAHDHERRRTSYIRLLRGSLQIAEQDHPDITPATNTTIIDDDRDANLESAGTYQGQLLFASKRRTYLVGFSQSPVGAPSDMVSDQFGCVAPNTMVEYDNGTVWISDRGPVAMQGGFVWVGQSLEPWFIGENARFLRDSRGMMRHAWGHHDAQRGLVLFGLFSNRNRDTADEVTVNYLGTSYTWDTAPDEAKSRFPCDTILVWSYQSDSWSVWYPQAGLEWLWATSGQDDTGVTRSVFLARDRRVYALDDQYATFNRGGGFTTVASRSTGTTITVSMSYGQTVAHLGSLDAYAAPGMRVLITRGSATESPFVVANTTLVSAVGATLTLAQSVSVEPGDVVIVGARSMRIRSTFRSYKGSDVSRIGVLAIRSTCQSLLTYATSSSLDTFPMLAFASANVQSTTYEHRTEQYGDQTLTDDGHAGYVYLSQSRAGDALVTDKALGQGANGGQNVRVDIEIVSGGSVRVQDIYASVS